ncbi:MAG TPA: hypothetical protein VL994_05555 [Steroidobacteraceae bacterium]|nr:hypothetical protein [Steroidobacteraceae bacterium]
MIGRPSALAPLALALVFTAVRLYRYLHAAPPREVPPAERARRAAVPALVLVNLCLLRWLRTALTAPTP